MNQRKRGILITYCTMVINIIAGFLYTPYMIKHLGASEYGVFSLSNSLISFISLLDLGFNQTMVRYIAKYRTREDKHYINTLNGFFLKIYLLVGATAIIIGVILLKLYPIFCRNTFTLEEVSLFKIVFSILLLNIVISFPMSVFSAALNAYEKFTFLRLVNMICIIIKYICIFSLLYLGYHLVTVVLVTCISAVSIQIFYLIYCRKVLNMRFEFKKHINKEQSKEICLFSFFIALNLLVDFIYNNTDKLLLGAICGTTMVSIYTIGIHFFTYFQELSTAISSVFLPKVVAIYEKTKDMSALSHLFLRVGKFQLILLVLVLCGFIACGDDFILLWVGEGFQESYIVGLLIMVPSLISLSQNIGISILWAMNRHKDRSYMQIVVAIFNFIISIPLSIKYGAIGAAAGTFIMTVMSQIYMNWYYVRKIHLDISGYWINFIKILATAVPVLILLVFIKDITGITNWIEFVIYVMLYVFVYSLAIWLIYLDKDERKNIFAQVYKILKR